MSQTTCAVLVERFRLEFIARQASKHPTRFISSGVLHHSLVMSHPLMPLVRFESMSRFHRFPSEPELSIGSRMKWEIRRTLDPLHPEPPVSSLGSSPHDAPPRDFDDPKDHLDHATVRGASPEADRHHRRALTIRGPLQHLFRDESTPWASTRTTFLTLAPRNEVSWVASLRHPSSSCHRAAQPHEHSEEHSFDRTVRFHAPERALPTRFREFSIPKNTYLSSSCGLSSFRNYDNFSRLTISEEKDHLSKSPQLLPNSLRFFRFVSANPKVYFHQLKNSP